MAISYVLMEGGLTFKTSRQGGRGLKSEDLRGTSFMDGPLFKNI